MRDDKLPKFQCSVLNLNPVPEWKGRSMLPENEQIVYREVHEQLIDYLTEALTRRDDPNAAIRIIAAAEKIVGEYLAEEPRPLPLLTPFHMELRAHLGIAFRMARRAFIRACFRHGLDPTTSGPEWVRGHEWEEDFAAVERHLREGARLNEGLWRGKAERQRLELQ
jgi:hypothetical protein